MNEDLGIKMGTDEQDRAKILVAKASFGSVEKFARHCGLGHSTIQKFLTGHKSLSTNSRLLIDKKCALGLSSANDVARLELGSYSKDSVEQDIAGVYTTIRTSADESSSYYAFKTNIFWNNESSCLNFQELYRDGAHSHQGEIAQFALANILYLKSNSKRGHGYRLITLCRKASDGSMSGFLVSCYENDSSFIPIVAPIVYIKSDLEIKNGTIRAEDAGFEFCQKTIAKSLSAGPSKLLLPDAFLPDSLKPQPREK